MSTQSNAILRQEERTLGVSPQWPARFAQFGRFHVDLQREELFREGQRLKVQTKIYDALLVLMRHAGEIVGREDVGKALWPEAARVNLDANVNTTINKLRAVLGDSSETPTYIETVPRRGYIFMPAIEFSEQRPSVTARGVAVTEQSAKSIPSTAVASWLFTRLKTAPTPLSIVTFVLAGMVLGALLVLAWDFVSDKQAQEDLGHANTSLVIPSVESYTEI
jgi:DNA-binding winged helix-turn-helix (wHTH) protein